MSLQPFFVWMENLPFSVAILNSVWQFAVLEAVHLVFLALFAGAVLIVDLRLLGRGLKDQPLAQLARDAHPWLMGSFLGLMVTGIPMIMSKAAGKYYESPVFWVKMGVLLVAVIFALTVRHKVAVADEARVGRFWAGVVGVVSITLWLGVAIGGRVIGFY